MRDRRAEDLLAPVRTSLGSIGGMLCETLQPVRLPQAELLAHPRWHEFGNDADQRLPELHGRVLVVVTARRARSIILVLMPA